MTSSPFLVRFVLVLVVAAAAGCSISDSSDSISKSISSPFTSSSKSSNASNRRYEEDVRNYTATYVRGDGATVYGLRSGLSDIAARHGITNWEADDTTFVAVGRGLARAGISGADYERYRDGIAAGDAGDAAAIDRGYKAGK